MATGKTSFYYSPAAAPLTHSKTNVHALTIILGVGRERRAERLNERLRGAQYVAFLLCAMSLADWRWLTFVGAPIWTKTSPSISIFLVLIFQPLHPRALPIVYQVALRNEES